MSLPSKLTIDDMDLLTEGGRIFTVEFIKRTNGERRVMNCRRGVSKGVTGRGRWFEPSAKALLPVYDMQVKDGNAHRFVSLDSLIALRLGGKSYEWNGEAFVEREMVAA